MYIGTVIQHRNAYVRASNVYVRNGLILLAGDIASTQQQGRSPTDACQESSWDFQNASEIC
jgi:hypothetical protein